MDLADLYFAKKALSVLFPKARFKDERCFATKKRQEALYKVGEDVDVFVILGSCTSNNTMKLCSIAKDNFPKADVYRINSMEELKAVKLEGKKRVALASGASTSPEFFNKVNDYLRKYKASNK
jgi:4-hydroxy-3-methylbut-2-enyl diphosphate reductase